MLENYYPVTHCQEMELQMANQTSQPVKFSIDPAPEAGKVYLVTTEGVRIEPTWKFNKWVRFGTLLGTALFGGAVGYGVKALVGNKVENEPASGTTTEMN